jgi:hypothetical protein
MVHPIYIDFVRARALPCHFPLIYFGMLFACFLSFNLLLLVHMKDNKLKRLPGGKKGTTSTSNEQEAHGILEGISSLHSWIKTQTMIRPHPKMGRGQKGAIYDEVCLYIFY